MQHATRHPLLARLFAAVVVAAVASQAQAVELLFDYTYDSGFFTDNPQAKLALQAAADDIEALLDFNPAAVSQSLFSATEAGKTLEITWSQNLLHPSTGATVKLPAYTESNPAAAGTITLYPGARILSGDSAGSSAALKALPAFLVKPSGAATNSLMQAASANSNAVMPRGDGPVMGSISGTLGMIPYSLQTGSFGGSLWFDADRNNDNIRDTQAIAEQLWHFDPASPAPAGKYDFYTVALQGMLKTLGFGFGIGELGARQVDGTTWKGPNAAALFENGAGLITSAGEVSGFALSPLLSDSAQQQVSVMAGGLTTGTRRHLTSLDAAFLRDLAYRIIPEPGASALLSSGMLLLGSCRCRPRA